MSKIARWQRTALAGLSVVAATGAALIALFPEFYAPMGAAIELVGHHWIWTVADQQWRPLWIEAMQDIAVLLGATGSIATLVCAIPPEAGARIR